MTAAGHPYSLCTNRGQQPLPRRNVQRCLAAADVIQTHGLRRRKST